MLIKLPAIWIISLNVAGWLAIQFGLAWGFTRMPADWFLPGPASTWEDVGRFYERCFAIKWWKDFLPDGAQWFSGGFAKSTLITRDLGYLERFIRETWRGELCHWTALACAPAFIFWNPLWGDLVIIAYAIAANIPCILVQRYNRLRLAKLQARGARASHATGKASARS